MEMDTPTLVRLKRSNGEIVQGCDVYIGRAINMGGWNLKTSKWANPFKVKDVGSVHRACELYLDWIVNEELLDNIMELEGKVLGCWCCNGIDEKADRWTCHGHVLIRLYEVMRDYGIKGVKKGLVKV